MKLTSKGLESNRAHWENTIELKLVRIISRALSKLILVLARAVYFVGIQDGSPNSSNRFRKERGGEVEAEA